MKFYICGGFGGIPISEFCETYIKPLIQKNGVTQILHIPFSRMGISHKIRDDQLPAKFETICKNMGVEYFNAMFFEDIEKFQNGLIFINGGTSRNFLLEMIKTPQLFEKIKNTDFIFGECSGATVFGEYFTNNNKDGFEKGLGIFENIIIASHYNQRKDNENMKKLYQQGKEQYNCKVIGVDEATFIEYENGKFGEKYGTGSATIIDGHLL